VVAIIATVDARRNANVGKIAIADVIETNNHKKTA